MTILNASLTSRLNVVPTTRFSTPSPSVSSGPSSTISSPNSLLSSCLSSAFTPPIVALIAFLAPFSFKLIFCFFASGSPAAAASAPGVGRAPFALVGESVSRTLGSPVFVLGFVLEDWREAAAGRVILSDAVPLEVVESGSEGRLRFWPGVSAMQSVHSHAACHGTCLAGWFADACCNEVDPARRAMHEAKHSLMQQKHEHALTRCSWDCRARTSTLARHVYSLRISYAFDGLPIRPIHAQRQQVSPLGTIDKISRRRRNNILSRNVAFSEVSRQN